MRTPNPGDAFTSAMSRQSWLLRAVIGLAILASLSIAVVGIGLGVSMGASNLIYPVVVPTFLAVGLLVVERRPGNALGPVLLLLGAIVASYQVLFQLDRSDPVAIAVYVAWFVSLVDGWLFALIAIVFLVFPDGHVLSPRWRPVVAASLIVAVLVTAATAIKDGPLTFYPRFENPFGIVGFETAEILDVLYVVAAGLIAVSASSLAGRWRQGGATERAQLKWVLVGAGVLTTVMGTYAFILGPSNYTEVVDLAIGTALGFFGITIGIAILRYRLFEIDRLISRTIGYGLVTAILVSAYAAAILILQGPLGAITGGDTVSVAASTLLAAALFQPVRRRVQQLVDQRFDRTRYDGERTATAFSVRMRTAPDLSSVSTDLDATVRQSIAPAHLHLWIRGTEQ